MGVFDFLSPAKRADAAAVDAKTTELHAVLAAQASGPVDTAGESVIGAGYVASVVHDRARLDEIVRAVRPLLPELPVHPDIELRVAGSDTPDAPFSLLHLPTRQADPGDAESIVRAHSLFLSVLPEYSLLVHGTYCGFTIRGVARADASRVTRLAIQWWAGLMASEHVRWPNSDLTIEIGDDHDDPNDPEISFDIGVNPHADDDDDDDDVSEVAAAPAEVRRRAARAAEAGRGALALLDAVASLPVRRGFTVKIGFTPDTSVPRVSVVDIDSYETDEEETREILDNLRAKDPSLVIGG